MLYTGGVPKGRSLPDEWRKTKRLDQLLSNGLAKLYAAARGRQKNKEITIFWPERRSFRTASNKKNDAKENARIMPIITAALGRLH